MLAQQSEKIKKVNKKKKQTGKMSCLHIYGSCEASTMI